MKTKILALILAICCLSATLVACAKNDPCETHVDENNDLACDVCGEALESKAETDTETETDTEVETEAEVVCDTHKDENADKFCDACGKAVVVVVEQIAPEKEDRVDMIVNTVDPNSTATKENYINTNLTSGAITVATPVDYIGSYGAYFWVRTANTDPATLLPVSYSHNVYNGITGENVFANDFVSTTNVGTFDIDFYANYFVVKQTPSDVTDPMTGVRTRSVTYTYYTYAGEKIYELAWAGTYNEFSNDFFNANGEIFADVYTKLQINDTTENGLAYITFDEKTYVVDLESDKIIHTERADTIINRPAFDEICDNYGYVMSKNSAGQVTEIHVYDLTKWIDCVYYYAIPSYYQQPVVVVLENGNILVQSYTFLAADAVSFDAVINSNKYDIVYTVIDVATKSESLVEFGYDIKGEAAVSLLKDVDGINVLRVAPIENDFVNNNAIKYLVVDNSLKVLFDLGAAMKSDMNLAVVGNNLFATNVKVGGTTVTEIVGADGAHVTYIPTGAVKYNNYLTVGTRIYNYKMEELTGYTVVSAFREYAIATKTNDLGVDEHYFVTVVDGAFKATPINFYGALECGYVASVKVPATDNAGQPLYDVDGITPLMRDDYKFYNALGAFVVDLDDAKAYNGIYVVNTFAEGVTLVSLFGQEYLVK